MLLTTTEAARYLGVSQSFLEKDRVSSGRIPHVKIGRAVRYLPADLDAYVQRRRRASTSDHGISA